MVTVRYKDTKKQQQLQDVRVKDKTVKQGMETITLFKIPTIKQLYYESMRLGLLH